MRNKYKSYFAFIKKHRIASSTVFLFLILICWSIYKKSSENIKYETILVTRGAVSEVVSVTGNVKPLSEVSLAFERGGRVSNLSISVGEKVYAGQSLASISNADLVASLDRAKADLKIAEIQLGNIQTNTQTNTLEVQNAKVDKATLDLAQAKITIINSIKDSFTKADDAVRNKIYSLFSDPIKYNARLNFTTDTFLQEDIEDGKDTISDTLDSWYRSLNNLTSTSDLEVYYNTAKLNLFSIKTLLDKCAEAVNGLKFESDGLTQTQIDTWKLNISSARSSIDLAVSALVGNFDSYQTAILALRTAESDFSVQEVSVEQARAGVASAEAELAKSIIKSPINGVVTNLGIKLGEIVSANKEVVSVISYGDYEIESFIPEADIAKIKVGNTAKATLDAYGSGVVLESVVTKVDPAATVIDGVPTYKVTLKFINKDERVRSGMTANIDILTNQKNDILIIPGRVITNNNNDRYVSVINPTDTSDILEKKIITGLRGLDGNVEVVSGLNEGDLVVTSITK